MSSSSEQNCKEKQKWVKLLQPPLLDFSVLCPEDKIQVVIYNTKHKFALDAEFSGTDPNKQPIFGSEVYANGKKFSHLSFGLPFMRFPQGSRPRIEYINKTKYTYNLHVHGLDSVGAVDGGSMEVVFGHNTQLGSKVLFQYPKIQNNQCLLWIHAHTMFVVMEQIYAGLVGLVQIVDPVTKWLTEQFEYGDNQILLTSLDTDLTESGTQTFENLPTDENRSCFSVINGTSAVNWYSDKSVVPFVNPLYHYVTKNLVKIDILNASANWRVFYIGVCDKNAKIHSFYLVQTDTGLMNPTLQTSTYVPVAGRTGIIIDLNDFVDQQAYLFFYNYDLTEILGSMPTFPDDPNNNSLIGTYPNLAKSANPTPYPTPIPDAEGDNSQNQQQNPTSLNYPTVPLIPQTRQILDAGGIELRNKSPFKKFKVFLKIRPKKGCRLTNLSLDATISKIRKVVFGEENYATLKSIIKQPCFEYNSGINYLSFLNPNYFYNLPKFNNQEQTLPVRNILLFPETNLNAASAQNPNGTTEYVNSTNRIMCDLWNSNELNLDWALEQYKNNPNNYKPPVLPTSKFRIYKTNDKYSNTAMISNDTLNIQIFNHEVAYGKVSKSPLTTVTVVFPATKPGQLLNIEEWTNVINQTFKETVVEIPGSEAQSLDQLLVCDWSFFPYKYNFLYQKTIYIKSAVIKTTNNSKYWFRLLGRWAILQFFGKPMTGNTLDPPPGDLMCHIRNKQEHRHKQMKKYAGVVAAHNNNTRNNSAQQQYNDTEQETKDKVVDNSNTRLAPYNNPSLYVKCDEPAIYGTYDAEIQQIFPFYATSDGDVQLPVACMKRNAELIIAPESTYIGLYDGYLNDNFNSFSVHFKSSENWNYINGDCADAHSLHFHLTSGYVIPDDSSNSTGLVTCKRNFASLLYPRDVYQIGPQQTLGFYLTWQHYSSLAATKSPPFRFIGGLLHCHLTQHESAGSMIVQYYVDISDN